MSLYQKVLEELSELKEEEERSEGQDQKKIEAEFGDVLLHSNASQDLVDKQGHLWALTCLMVASKYDEHDPNIPFYKEFTSMSSRADFE